jgi:hypothetical protein
VITVARLCLFCLALVWLPVRASAQQTDAASSGTKSLHAFLAAKKGGKRTTTFSADVPQINVFWKGQGFQAGDTVQVIWIGEEVGAGSKESEIRRANYKVFKETEEGGFSLVRPAGRTWPLGRYRVELYINGSIAEVVKFTIKPGVTIETN